MSIFEDYILIREIKLKCLKCYLELEIRKKLAFNGDSKFVDFRTFWQKILISIRNILGYLQIPS
jgi:hypothetical protein